MIEEKWDCIVNFPIKKEKKLPKSWMEFCEIYPLTAYETYIDKDSMIEPAFVNTNYSNDRKIRLDKNVLPNHATAEAVLALCQLIQLRNAYNGDWVPDWSEGTENKYCIDFAYGNIGTCTNHISPLLLYFKTKELRDEFLRNFRPLIEKLKPLYGIKEGGEE